MKKFLSNKNKMWISFVIMNLFAYVGLVFSNLIRGISILFSLGSFVLTFKCSSFIYEKFFERNKNKYCDELSCRFFYNNKDINLSVVNNVINRIEASQLEANHNNDSANELGKNNTVSNQLFSRYVPGVSPTIAGIMNRYNCGNSRRGPVRARRKPEDKRK